MRRATNAFAIVATTINRPTGQTTSHINHQRKALPCLSLNSITCIGVGHEWKQQRVYQIHPIPRYNNELSSPEAALHHPSTSTQFVAKFLSICSIVESYIESRFAKYDDGVVDAFVFLPAYRSPFPAHTLWSSSTNHPSSWSIYPCV